VTASIKLKRAARLRIRALDGKGKHRLVLLAGSKVGTIVSRHDGYAISARMAHGGKLTLRLRLARAQLVSGRKFRILVDTMGRHHAVATARLDVVAP
jgi:hypothetical protein